MRVLKCGFSESSGSCCACARNKLYGAQLSLERQHGDVWLFCGPDFVGAVSVRATRGTVDLTLPRLQCTVQQYRDVVAQYLDGATFLSLLRGLKMLVSKIRGGWLSSDDAVESTCCQARGLCPQSAVSSLFERIISRHRPAILASRSFAGLVTTVNCTMVLLPS